MNLTRSAEALGCAPTSDLREGIRAGVRPGLQNRDNAASATDVAGVEQVATRYREGVKAHAVGARRPDGNRRQRVADVADLVAAYCATGCTTPPSVRVAGEAMCWDCAEDMGALS